MDQRELAENIIAMDIKTAKKVLNYKGAAFSKIGQNILEGQGNYLLEVRTRYCKKCGKRTSQEWVRNHHFYYWRCPECLEKHLETIGTFTPNGYFKKTSLNLEV